MIRGRDFRTIVYVLLLTSGIGLSGCNSVERRNLTDAILVTTAPTPSEGDTRLVLELRDAREELSLSEVDAFLASDRSAELSRANRARLRDRCEALRLTLPRARQEMAGGVAILRPDPNRPFADGNLVAYVSGQSAVRVLFSLAEIGRLLALRECTDDLAAIRYTHPEFDSERLLVLRDRVAALDLNVANLSPSPAELERLKTEAATRVLDRCLRQATTQVIPQDGMPQTDNSPPTAGLPLLTTSGPWSSFRSPKLTAALKDRSVIERILHDHDPDTLRALVFLVRRNVVELDYP